MTVDTSSLPSSFERARARAQGAGVEGDWRQAARWAERAWRLADRRPLPSLEFAAALAKAGDGRATHLLSAVARQIDDFPVLLALAASQSRAGAYQQARATLHRLLRTVALDALNPATTLASDIAAWAGLAGWLGWRHGRLLFGAARGTPDLIAFDLDGHALPLHWISEAPQVWSTSLPPNASGRLGAARPLLGIPLRPDRFETPEGLVSSSAMGVSGWVSFPRDPGRQPAVTITLSDQGCRSGIVVPDLRPVAPTESQPFARRWEFDFTLPPETTVLAVKEAGSGRSIPFAATPGEHTRPPRKITALRDGRDVDTLLLQRCRAQECVVLVTHDEGGGIERRVKHRLGMLQRAGKVGLLLRSQRNQPGKIRLELGTKTAEGRGFRLPAEGSELLGLLRKIGPARIEYHQPRRHDGLVWQIARSLNVPYEVHLHDYALLCPRVTLIDADGKYCGEPPVSQCERCIQSLEHRHLLAPAGVAALRRQSSELLSHAQRVLAPSADIAVRFRHHFPDLAITVRPWEARRTRAKPASASHDHVHVCVVGALNHHKGFDVLLECARDAAVRALPIRFTVVGHTSDDNSLIEAGVFVTGPYTESERADLIARQQADVGFLPSIWPEPWCYSLTGLLEAALPTLCFDIGAQSARVRSANGHVLPLETPAPDINQQILKLHHLTMRN